MNLFLLDTNPKKAAEMHNDAHCVKMVLEVAQLLCTTHRLLDGDDNVEPTLYKTTHKNHPCAVWVRENDRNYAFAYRLFSALCREYTFRYGKTHKTEIKLKRHLKRLPKNIHFVDKMTEPPQCMPDEFKVRGKPIQAYRKYYMNGKAHLAKWKAPRRKPAWFTITQTPIATNES